MKRFGDCGEPSTKSRRRYSPIMTEVDSCQIMVDNSQNVLNILRNLYVDKQMCDVYLVVGSREHSAHRLILCASSDVFQAMLMKPEWCEWNESRVELQELPECENVFHLFLEYFYTGKILITHTNAMPILALADKYIVKGLSRLCIDYMCKHVPHSASHNQLFIWLQYATSCWHTDLAEICQNYIKWNLQSVANTPDFSNFDADMLCRILQQNDLVVYNEMVLFNCVVRWLDLQKIKIFNSDLATYQLDKQIVELIEKVMRYIRFPMMSPRELADLLILPLIKQHKDFFVDRMAIGMTFHSGCQEQIQKIRLKTSDGNLLFTPRLYTSDVYSALLVIDNFNSLPSYHISTFVFSSQMSSAEYESDEINDWVVHLYPKGVWFKKCYLIVWQGTLEVPEETISTVRLSLTCRKLSISKVRVKVSVLIYGIQGGVEHVMEVREKIYQFNDDDKVLNLDNLIPFEELNPMVPKNNNFEESPYLIGPNRDQLKLNIVITCLDS